MVTGPMKVPREWAEEAYRRYKQHGRPSRPYYTKCTHCEEFNEHEGSLLDVDHDVSRHAGVHEAIDNVDAEIIVLDAVGRELYRKHAKFKPEHEESGCPSCGAEEDSSRIACPECGHIPEEARLA